MSWAQASGANWKKAKTIKPTLSASSGGVSSDSPVTGTTSTRPAQVVLHTGCLTTGSDKDSKDERGKGGKSQHSLNSLKLSYVIN